MEENHQTVFRKKTLERISSPDQLTDYLCVTNPGIWVILVAVILLLAGVFAWSMVGTLETKAEVKIVVSDHTAQIIPLGSHDLFLCNIQDVHVRNDLIDVTGAVHLENARLIGYEHGQYFSLSSKACGFFGYSVASQQALLRRKRHANTRVKESNHHDPQSKTSGDCAKRYPKNSL